VAEEKATCRFEVEVALTAERGDAETHTAQGIEGDGLRRLADGEALVTGVAAAKLALPAWVAWSVHVQR